MEDPDIVQMNIDRYQAMLKLSLDDDTLARVSQLLGEARCRLATAIELQGSVTGSEQIASSELLG